MVPTSYLEVGLFMVLAVGAALVLGTGAALLRYRRTGAFPGEDDQEAGQAPERARGDRRVRHAVARLVLGTVLLACGVGALAAVRDAL